MIKLTKIALCGLFLTSSLAAFANDKPLSIDDLVKIAPEAQHKVVAERVYSRFVRMHYKNETVDTAFATALFNRYLDQLDYSHNVLTQEDITYLHQHSSNLLNELKSAKLNIAYDVYNYVQKKRFERLEYALSLLDEKMDFTKDESLDFERNKDKWPANMAEVDDLWRKRVKFDELNLLLAGKTEEEAKEILKKRYNLALKRLTQVRSEDVFQSYMNAFARQIDPHTSYLSPRATKQFDSEMNLSLEGIGAVLRSEDDYTVISSLIKGGPAEKSGLLQAGDRIVGVGQDNQQIEDVVGWRLDDIVEKIKGKKGTKVYLDILPEGLNSKIKHITLIREKIRLEDSAAKLTLKKVNGKSIGVITIPGFYMGLSADVIKIINEAQKEKVNGLLIDLRSNGGGALTEAINLSGLFISKGPVVLVRDSLGNIKQYDSQQPNPLYNGPLMVIIDKNSASASEIFAAAMQDYHRALIVGEPSFGKGTVQTHQSLDSFGDRVMHPNWSDLGAVQFTIQKFYRINGGSTQLKGVTPDILMVNQDYNDEYGEKYLDNALPWDSIPSVNYQKFNNPNVNVNKLIKEHLQRIKNNRQFQYIIEDITEFNNNKAERYLVSLNKKQREDENKKNEEKRLARINEDLKEQGKPIISSVENIPKDYDKPDPFLQESLNILTDYIH